ncbi:MAG: type II secretion system F family protein [Beutenbergiaceae bacterium]
MDSVPIFITGLLVLAAVVLTHRQPRSTVPRRRRGWSRLGTRKELRSDQQDVAPVLVELAAQLRAGCPIEEAWKRALPHPMPEWAGPMVLASGVDPVQAWPVESEAGTVQVPQPRSARVPSSVAGLRTSRRWHRLLRRRTPASRSAVAAATAACRLSGQSGAPLVEVIDLLVHGIAEAKEVDDLRRVALAGPRASARLLAWLPVFGIGLGILIGADPVGVLLSGGIGGLCLVGGTALFVAGRRWVTHLVGVAEQAGR